MANETVQQEKVLSPTAYFTVQGARPTQEEAARLSALPFERKKAGAAEVNEGIKWFLIGIVAAVFAWFFGNWVIKGFRGPGVLIFGYGLAFVGMPAMLVFAFSFLFKLFGSARKKHLKDALNWVWRRAYLGEASGGRFGKEDISLSVLHRMVPDSIPFDREKMSKYLYGLRKTLDDAADRTTLPAMKNPPGDWNLSHPHVTCVITGEKEIHPSVKEVEAVLTFYDNLARSTGNQSTETICTAVLEISIVESFVNASGYWFPYDLYPSIKAVANPESPDKGGETL